MKRRPNFSTMEMDALIDGVAASRDVVASACPGRVSKASKEREWQAITSRVNSASPLHRTVGEVRKKWKNLRMVTKAKKEALMSDLVQVCRSSGGNSAVDTAAAALKQLTPAECRVIEILDGASATASLITEDATTADVAYSADNNGDGDGCDVAADACNTNKEVDQNDDDEAWSVEGDERPLVIDRSEIILTRHFQQPTPLQLAPRPSLSLPPLPPLQPPPTLSLMPTPAVAPATKPSILTVVETLQRRLLAEASSATSSETTPMLSPQPPEPLSAAPIKTRRHRRCCCCCCSSTDADDNGERGTDIEQRLLRAKERRLRLEREKVSALREIVANLREISRAMTAGGGASLVGPTSFGPA